MKSVSSYLVQTAALSRRRRAWWRLIGDTLLTATGVSVWLGNASNAEVILNVREPENVALPAGPAVLRESKLTITASLPLEKLEVLANNYQLSHASGTLAGLSLTKERFR